MFNKLNILCDLMFRKYASKNTASLIKACYGHIKICSKLKKNFRVCKLEGMHLYVQSQLASAKLSNSSIEFNFWG